MRPHVICEGHPTPKGTLRRGWGRTLFYPKGVKEWEAVVGREAARGMKAAGFPLMLGRVAVGLRFYITPTKGGKRPGRLRGDVDKLTRAVLDAFTGVVYEDDEQVTTLLAGKYAVEKGSVERVEATIAAHYEVKA